MTLLQPGEAATIRVTLDLTHRSYRESGVARRPFAVSLRPLTRNAKPRGAGWRLHGTIQSRITLDTPTIHFGERTIHGQTPVTQKVVATVHVPCERLEVAIGPAVASATVKQREDDEKRFEITIAANSSLSPGHFKGEARIYIVEPCGGRTLGVVLPIAGEMQPGVRLLPARVLLEPKPVGETAEAVVTLQAPQDAKVVVDHIEIDDPALRVEPASIKGISAGRAYRLRQRVAKEGEHVSKARFFPDHDLIKLTVEVCYRGQSGKKIAGSVPKEEQP